MDRQGTRLECLLTSLRCKIEQHDAIISRDELDRCLMAEYLNAFRALEYGMQCLTPDSTTALQSLRKSRKT